LNMMYQQVTQHFVLKD